MGQGTVQEHKKVNTNTRSVYVFKFELLQRTRQGVDMQTAPHRYFFFF